MIDGEGRGGPGL